MGMGARSMSQMGQTRHSDRAPTFRSTPISRQFRICANSGSDAYSRSRRRETAIALNRYRGNPHLERVVLR
jgi:D-serine deaminase-like pyridoxal phosphate-dependent protein